jgi:hypothetical protein
MVEPFDSAAREAVEWNLSLRTNFKVSLDASHWKTALRPTDRCTLHLMTSIGVLHRQSSYTGICDYGNHP